MKTCVLELKVIGENDFNSKKLLAVQNKLLAEYSTSELISKEIIINRCGDECIRYEFTRPVIKPKRPKKELFTGWVNYNSTPHPSYYDNTYYSIRKKTAELCSCINGKAKNYIPNACYNTDKGSHTDTCKAVPFLRDNGFL